MRKLSIQETFDRVATHLLTQGTKSMRLRDDDEVPYCAYRGQGGLKCAVGVLIDDQQYTPKLERYWVGALSVQNALEKSGVNIQNTELRVLLSELQHIHDEKDVPDWKNALQRLALRLGVSAAALEKF